METFFRMLFPVDFALGGAHTFAHSCMSPRYSNQKLLLGILHLNLAHGII